MRNRKIAYSIIVFLLLVLLILFAMDRVRKNQDLDITFLNVGQGDSILISQGHNQILIDGGRSGQVLLEKLGNHIPFWDREIEMVIITHPDQDHIGGFLEAFKAYSVQTVMMTEAKSSSKTYASLLELISKEGSSVIEGKRGVTVKFPDGSRMKTLHPFSSVIDSKDTNSTSIVNMLESAGIKFLLTGDLTEDREKEIVRQGIDIGSDYLKVAHHGSKYSTSDSFLEKVSPSRAIISVGRNSYGHPSEDVLGKLKKKGIEVLRTDGVGDISYSCKRSLGECVLQN